MFIALMTIPRSVFIPWEYLKIWTVLKAFALSYVLLGVISISMRLPDIGIHLVLAAATVAVVSVGLCWLSFGNFYYIVSWSHTPAFFVIIAVLLFAGTLVIRRCRSDEQTPAEQVAL
ncbi:hypothetical protein N8528_00530 [Akkermansiaceae bacterium]|nr:hypothetical protein [Akkermansiaceae bacterium]